MASSTLPAVKDCEKHWESQQTNLETVKHFILGFAQITSTDEQLSKNEKRAEGDSLISEMEKCIEMQRQSRASQKALHHLQTQFRDHLNRLESTSMSSEEVKALEYDLEGQFINKVEEEKEKLASSRSGVEKKFEDLKRIVEGMDDDEIMMTQGSLDVNTICPITATDMVNPMRNTTCGHSYSKIGILSHIEASKGVGGVAKCPVAGCQAMVKRNQLERDTDLEIVLRQKAQLKKSQRSYDDDDVEDIAE